MRVRVKLGYRGQNYTFIDHWDYDDFSDAYRMHTTGNYGCDCNRSLFIGWYCKRGFPEMRCGQKIALVSLTSVRPKQALKKHGGRKTKALTSNAYYVIGGGRVVFIEYFGAAGQ